MKINLTQKTFDELVSGLNHRMSRIESDIGWLKWLVCGIFIAMIIGVFI